MTIQSMSTYDATNRVQMVYIPYLKEYLSIGSYIYANKNKDNNVRKMISLESATYMIC